MSEGKKEISSRGEMLRKLREAHAETVQRAAGWVREQKQLHQAICQYIRETPRTIP